MEEKEIGVVTHYFTHISVAAIKITSDSLSVGDTIHIKGHTSDFNQKVDSMQIEHQSIQTANVGDVIGLRVTEHAREDDKVYKVASE
ncbi:hypothetical protein AUJ66_08015 [Candidatus Desantisbacteria bacterium CG1_02_38_46]|uniref:Translation elongation factor-like protein n=3 Tax=unclassified Candidatus Desantisiibacteriota TaxID=3106372 RepID=A0A2H9P9K6_9BACT|nr:MAG: hypothetical protein AUJ66_08015 [Candidatus Desantisbacteria bacterium CG1_02_38_46]PIU51686.1 MAG: translation elongation factor-like protein [Candidatus Desantisbacteria bacterium CG07_land_8_20_14_0_80_39_15]PIZ14967.1 MAG: translation elongation factor-like protein [Candidatus Desantisbacteria bacterium CG_4_10_14_0_8_um_filter_39_17]